MKVSLLLISMGLLCCCMPVLSATGNLSCATINPFLESMVKKGSVEIYPSPIPIDGHCSGEWKVNGGCCKVDSLKKYVKKDKRLLARSTNVIFIGFNIAKKVLGKLAKTIKKIFRSNKKKVPVELKKMFKYKKSRKSQLKDYTKCWNDELFNLRSNSICYTCSGKSHKNYFRDGMALITEHTCKKSLGVCMPSLKDMAYLLSSVSKVWKASSKLRTKGARRSGAARKYLKRLRTIMYFFHRFQLTSIFKKYYATRKKSKSKEAIQAETKFCELFISLKRKPLVYYMKSLLYRTVRALIGIVNFRNIVNRAKFWKYYSRRIKKYKKKGYSRSKIKRLVRSRRKRFLRYKKIHQRGLRYYSRLIKLLSKALGIRLRKGWQVRQFGTFNINQAIGMKRSKSRLLNNWNSSYSSVFRSGKRKNPFRRDVTVVIATPFACTQVVSAKSHSFGLPMHLYQEKFP